MNVDDDGGCAAVDENGAAAVDDGACAVDGVGVAVAGVDGGGADRDGDGAATGVGAAPAVRGAIPNAPAVGWVGTVGTEELRCFNAMNAHDWVACNAARRFAFSCSNVWMSCRSAFNR